jgi:O-Antigen ligase
MAPEGRSDTLLDAPQPAWDRPLPMALVCAILTLAVLRPPETYAWSGAACSVLLAAAGCLLMLGPGCVPALPAWTAGLLPLAFASLVLASCRARALDEAAAALALILAAFLGRELAAERRARDLLAGLLAALGAIAAILAVLQHHLTYPGELRALLEAGEEPPLYIVARLQAGRPSGPFTLPAALGGFFALTLPLTLFAARRSVGRWPRGLAMAGAVLQAYALYLTRSFGGLIAVSVALILTIPALAPRRRGILLAAAALASMALVASFLQDRRAEVEAPGGHPLTLRAGNWRAAGEMIRDHPLLGTGPGSFGTFYPRYMRPGMNETRYAHDSYLQVISGWGLWSIVPLAAFLLAFTGRLRLAWKAAGEDLPFVAAGAGFLIHNLVDFTAYLPGVAIPSAIVIGATLRPGGSAAPERLARSERAARPAPPGRRATIVRAVPAVAALLFYLGHALVSFRAGRLLEEARAAAAEGNAPEALALARQASRARPDDPIPRGFISEWVLTQGMDDVDLREEGLRQAKRAVRLDPESAILHYDLSLSHGARREWAAAYRERYIAHSKFPFKETYRLPETVKAAEPPP